MNTDSQAQKPHLQRSITSWNNIQSPGTYVSVDGQLLFRVQEDSLAAGRSPLITIVSSENGTEGLSVARISENPNITLTKARQLCADSDLHPSF